MTAALNLLLHGLHLLVIVFSLTGWMIPVLRPYHLILCLLIAFSWFVLGAGKGWGYCLITDWQWQMMRRMGRTDLPAGYMPMLYRYLTDRDGDEQRIKSVTQWVFYGSFLASLIVNRELIHSLFTALMAEYK